MKRNFSSIGLHSFQGIWALPQIPLCVNHVSGTFCKLSVDNYSRENRQLSHHAVAAFFFNKTSAGVLRDPSSTTRLAASIRLPSSAAE